MEAIKFIVNWIIKYCKNHNINTLVIGVSGGIDSAVTSTLCAKTGINTIVVSLPIYQKEKELNRALKHQKWLLERFKNVQCETINLDNLFDSWKTNMPNKYHSSLSLANSRARIRMTTLYQIASTNNGIVVGTGNKIEDFGIGFFTKYGDGGVDISPIADLKKSEVTHIGKQLEIINEIIIAPPTDGLWEDGRTDEDQIGITYDELEWAMDFKGSTKYLSKQQKASLKKYRELHSTNQHKIKPIPVCILPKNRKFNF